LGYFVKKLISAKNNQEWDDSILFDAKLSLMLDGGQYLKKEKTKY
jgi:hypothetical protein